MTDHYDTLETRPAAERESELFSRLPHVLRAAMQAPAYAARLKGLDPATMTDRAALARKGLRLYRRPFPIGAFRRRRCRRVRLRRAREGCQ